MRIEIWRTTSDKIIKTYKKGTKIPEKFYAGPFTVEQDVDAVDEGRQNIVKIYYKGKNILDFYCYTPEYADEEKKTEFKKSIGELAYTTNANFLQDVHISWTDRGENVEGWAIKLLFDTEAYVIKTIERPDNPGVLRVATWKLINRFIKEDEDPENRSYLVGQYLVTVLDGWDEGRPALEIEPDDEIKKAVVYCFERTNQIVGAYRIRKDEWIIDLYNEDGKLLLKKQYYRKVIDENDFSRVHVRKVAIPIGVKFILL